jgi:uncharacterized membrane protein
MPELAPNLSLPFSLIILLSLLIWMYFLFIYKGKYKNIIKLYEKGKNNKHSIIAILFPLFGFVLLNISWILKLLQNQEKI